MADATKVMALGFRKLAIENELNEVQILNEMIAIGKDNWPEERIEIFKETADKLVDKASDLKNSLKEAEQDWLEAGEQYKKEHWT